MMNTGAICVQSDSKYNYVFLMYVIFMSFENSIYACNDSKI